jgi:hypothetical protein
MKAIQSALVWFRVIFSPTIVMTVYHATRDGVVTSDELSKIVAQMDFRIKIPFMGGAK